MAYDPYQNRIGQGQSNNAPSPPPVPGATWGYHESLIPMQGGNYWWNIPQGQSQPPTAGGAQPPLPWQQPQGGFFAPNLPPINPAAAAWQQAENDRIMQFRNTHPKDQWGGYQVDPNRTPRPTPFLGPMPKFDPNGPLNIGGGLASMPQQPILPQQPQQPTTGFEDRPRPWQTTPRMSFNLRPPMSMQPNWRQAWNFQQQPQQQLPSMQAPLKTSTISSYDWTS